jgi:addiction module RelE/StbE family toxin
MGRVVWTDEALRQLELIHAYIEQFDQRAAQRFAARLVAASESLAEFPHRGRLDGPDVRALTIVPPYVVLYRRTGDDVIIADIRHGRRRREP